MTKSATAGSAGIARKLVSVGGLKGGCVERRNAALLSSVTRAADSSGTVPFQAGRELRTSWRGPACSAWIGRYSSAMIPPPLRLAADQHSRIGRRVPLALTIPRPPCATRDAAARHAGAGLAVLVVALAEDAASREHAPCQQLRHRGPREGGGSRPAAAQRSGRG